jgi:hypothetical protein
MGSSTEQQCESGFGKNKVGEIYKLYATTPAQSVELTFALIGRPSDPVVYSRFYFVGDWLANEWEIVEITNTQVVVINATCGTEESLPPGGRRTETPGYRGSGQEQLWTRHRQYLR